MHWMTLGLVGKTAVVRGMVHGVGRQNRFFIKNSSDYGSWVGMYWN